MRGFLAMTLGLERLIVGAGMPIGMSVLVSAATRHEATREIAEAVAEGLRNRRIDAEALPIEEVMSLEGYAAAVIGSAVYPGRWLASARELVVANVSALLAMPMWLFSSGPVGPPEHLIPPGEPADARVRARLTRARAHRVFAGRLDRHRLDLEERSSSHIVHAPDADYRDWAAIDAFAGEIADGLLADTAAGSRWHATTSPWRCRLVRLARPGTHRNVLRGPLRITAGFE